MTIINYEVDAIFFSKKKKMHDTISNSVYDKQSRCPVYNV